MLLLDLVPLAKVMISTLSDSDDEEVVNFLLVSIYNLSTRLCTEFVIVGNDYLTYDITSPEMTNGLKNLILLQAKQIANGSSTVLKTKVGSIMVEYDPDALSRDQAYLDKLINEYADENGINLPGSTSIVAINEYDLLLNCDLKRSTIDNAFYGNLGF